jgi:hypothetical protein
MSFATAPAKSLTLESADKNTGYNSNNYKFALCSNFKA